MTINELIDLIDSNALNLNISSSIQQMTPNRLNKSTEMALRTLTFWMLYLSPVVNPLLYVLRLPKVRNEVGTGFVITVKRIF